MRAASRPSGSFTYKRRKKKMLRWLMRLIILGLIGLAIMYVLRRFMGQEEDFDEYDDIESGFEFQETPVEIDVPADTSGSTAQAAQGGAGSSENMDTGGSADADTSAGATTELPGLIEINGIGASYEARLQAAGINTVEDLASADANALNEQLDVIGGASAIEDWIAQAKELTSGGSRAQSNGRTQ
jgi:predicted flap endonuclease-1-like 5' DNA nuclease